MEQLQKQAVEPAEDVPVDVAEVVALDVVAIVGELGARAPATGTLLALRAADEEPPHHQLEVLKLRDQSGVEERLAFLHVVFFAATGHPLTLRRKAHSRSRVNQCAAFEKKTKLEDWRSKA